MRPQPFACSQCGHCCNTWKVPIEAERLEPLLQRQWVKELLSKFNAEFEPIDDWGAFLPHKPNQECVFWEDAQGCLIHHHEGSQAKPLDCQRFPFSRLPDLPPIQGNTQPPTPPRFDVSAACSTVAKTLQHPQGLTLEPGTLEALSAEESHHTPSPFYPSSSQPLTQYARYPWPLHHYHPLHATEFAPMMEDSVRPYLYPNGGEGGVQHTAWQALRHAEAVLFNQRLRTLPPKAPPQWWVQHQLALWLRSDYGNYPRWQWRIKGEYQDARLFGDTRIHRTRLQAIAWPGVEKNAAGRAFVYHLLRRESALAFGASLWHHVRLARLGLLLFEFYAPAFALHEGVNRVEAAHMELAIRCIERYYTAHQPRILARLEASPWLML
jgi:hypothetical protein